MKKMKIVFLDQGNFQKSHESFDYSALESLGELVLYQDTSKNLVLERTQNADVILVLKTKLDDLVMSQLGKTKLICKVGTGYDNIDTLAAKEKNIVVTNFPGYATNMVAQWTITFILTMASNVVFYDQAVKKNQWAESQFLYPIREIQNASLGVIGYGHIGKRVALLASHLGMKVYVNSNYAAPDRHIRLADRDEIFKECDFVSLHSLLNERTRNMVDAEVFNMMKPASFLINTGRAGLVNQTDLLNALQTKKIAGAAFDGFWQEPPENDNPLFKLDNFFITPHVGWGSLQTKQALLNDIARRIKDFSLGMKIHTV
jgi:glycerate dehydrogenase